MSLSDIQNTLKLDYHSDSDDIAASFYVPCLTNSIKYDRAVGYFTSDSLKCVALGLVNFVKKPGSKMRLIASPVLNEKDETALRNQLPDQRIEEIKKIVMQSFEAAVSQASTRHLEFMSWMIQQKKLEIKLAYRAKHDGIYHEKIGIFTDADSVSIAFTGSMNETGRAIMSNVESFDVFIPSNSRDRERIISKIASFEKLWNGGYDKDRLVVLDFTEASDALLSKYRRANYEPPTNEDELFDEDQTSVIEPQNRRLERVALVTIPSLFKIRGYQQEAQDAWFKAKGRGIIEMATGCGKTKTALTCVARMQLKNKRLFVVVAAPYKHLCRQWANDVKLFGVDPVLCFESRDAWTKDLEAALAYQNQCTEGSVVACVTNSTLQSETFRQIIKKASVPLLFIGDEVHNMGSEMTNISLPDSAPLRLGLSATPMRQGDDEGSANILNYFGDIIYKFTLKQAIDKGHLTPYDYHPVLVSLTKFEADIYVELTKRYAKFASSKEPRLKKIAETILFQRSRLIGSAFNKIEALVNLIKQTRLNHGLVYCSDGSVIGPEGESLGPQIDIVVNKLRQLDPPILINRFTYEENTEVRDDMIANAESGSIDGLAAIRCLDEGVDIPSLKIAFIMASSKTERQSIQRRGRLLRLSNGKSKAVIYDFFILPPESESTMPVNLAEWERKLLESEIARCYNFAKLALNCNEAINVFSDLRSRLNLNIPMNPNE